MDNPQMGGMLEVRPQLPVIESLKRQRADLQKRVEEFDKAIKTLEENPEFQKLYDIMNKVIRY